MPCNWLFSIPKQTNTQQNSARITKSKLLSNLFFRRACLSQSSWRFWVGNSMVRVLNKASSWGWTWRGSNLKLHSLWPVHLTMLTVQSHMRISLRIYRGTCYQSRVSSRSVRAIKRQIGVHQSAKFNKDLLFHNMISPQSKKSTLLHCGWT